MSTSKSKQGQQQQRQQVDNGAVSEDRLQEYKEHFVKEPAGEMLSRLRDYANEKPDVAALWCFGLGVFLGWKLKG